MPASKTQQHHAANKAAADRIANTLRKKGKKPAIFKDKSGYTVVGFK